MGRRTLLLALLGLVVLAGLGWFFSRRADSLSQRTSASGNQIIPVGVETLVENPDRYRGKVRVRGIVGRILFQQQLFSLVDTSDRDELLEKGVTQCVTLPVRWMGPMPAVHDEVLVQGEVQDSNGKLLFAAQTVEKPAGNSAAGHVR